jgi:hypothetical protein
MTETLAAPAPVVAGRRRDWAPVRADVAAALPPWAVSRVLVLGAWGVAHFLVRNLHVQDAAVRQQAHEGLFAWDAGWYRGIAQHGYGFGGAAAGPHEALRFFPLLPAVARALGSSSVAMVVVVWASALVLGALVHRLVLTEGKGEHLARLACWCVAVFPSAFVLVMGYAEALAMALAVGVFIALRARRWWWAAGLGVLAGLSRPLGVLLVVPAAVEVGRAVGRSVAVGRSGAVGRSVAVGRSGAVGWSVAVGRVWGRGRGSVTGRVWAAWAAAVVGPAIGLLAFLAWSWRRYGDFLLPLRVQTHATHRGQVVDPVTALWHGARGVFHGHVGSALHVPWAILFVALAVVAFRRWPASYGAFATAVLVVALTSKNLDSLERYGLGAFPLILALATLLTRPWLERAWLTLSAGALGGYALLALLNAYVP